MPSIDRPEFSVRKVHLKFELIYIQCVRIKVIKIKFFLKENVNIKRSELIHLVNF